MWRADNGACHRPSTSTLSRIKPDRAPQIIGEVNAAVADWREAGRTIGMNARELDGFEEAFEHGERRSAARIVFAL